MRKLIACLCLAISGHAGASPTTCPGFFAGGQAPDLLSPSLVSRAHGVCYRFYAVVESGVTRTTLWSAERLTRESVVKAHDVERIDLFHAEPSISHADRAEHEDFEGSGLDQGHNSPSGDMPDVQSQYESFSLANISPQSHDNNLHLWEGIEIATRAIARYDGEVYVVTGPAFIGQREIIGGRVEVPTHIWKAIYDPKRGAAAYVTMNRPGNAYAVVSIAEIARITGVDPFPALPQSMRVTAIELPTPRPRGRPLRVGPVSESSLGLGGPNMISTVSGPTVVALGESRRVGWGERSAERHVARALVRALTY